MKILTRAAAGNGKRPACPLPSEIHTFEFRANALARALLPNASDEKIAEVIADLRQRFQPAAPQD